MRHVPLSLTSSDRGLARLTSAVEGMSMSFSFVGANVGKLVSSSSSADCVGEEVKGEDFVIQSSLLI